MFEQASKTKMRFTTTKGALTVEDLWDMPLSGATYSLDCIAKGLRKALKEYEEESFVTPTSKHSETLELQFELVKHIINVRLEEIKAKNTAAVERTQRAKIKKIIETKEDAELLAMPLDKLKEML